MFRLSCIVFAAGFVAPLAARAHGDLHDQIASVTGQIRQDPRNAMLFLKRGELYRVHGEWDAAQADYDQVTQFAPDFAAIDFFRGRMLLEAGRSKPARKSLDRFLERQPDHAEALIARARVLVKLGEGEAAANDFTRAITRVPDPKPDYYLERAQALVSAGDGHVDDALRGLDEGIQRLGPLVALRVRAIDLELLRKDFDGALARLEQIIAQSPRRETWLARKGDILEQAGRTREAREAFAAALTAIESLPPNHRKSKTIVALENRLRPALGPQAPAATVTKPSSLQEPKPTL
jgi:tetratricopeptide (TPR) repeat protein